MVEWFCDSVPSALPRLDPHLLQAYQQAQEEVLEGMPELPSWRETLKPLAKRAVKSAFETGAFDDLR